MQKIILASGSPRRKQILELANIQFEIKVVPTDECHPPGLSPAEVAIHIAENKAKSVNDISHNKQENIVLAADTIVVLDNEIMGKPAGRNDAIKILHKLSGRKHLVITGVVILHDKTTLAFADTTEVEFNELTNEQVEYYIDNYKPFDKAGAYAIQEWIGAVGIKRINGDFYNVMGLPINRVIRALEKMK